MGNELRVIQLNAGTFLEPDWDRRRDEIVAWIRCLAPDVVCLQEIWQDERTGNTAEWLAEQMPEAGWHWRFGGGPFHEELWPDPSLLYGSAILSRWPIDDSTCHMLPLAADPGTVVAGVPWQLLHVRTAGLDVFSCHLAAPLDAHLHRRAQVLAVDSVIAAARNGKDPGMRPGWAREGMPAILCGDLNAEPDSDEVRYLCGLTALDGRTTFYQDAWRAAGEGPGYTQDWRNNAIASTMNVNRRRIDYVFVGDPYQRVGGAGRVLRADLAFHESLTGTVASDHAGLVVDICWPDRPDDPRRRPTGAGQ